jgi:hypothetical protein
MLIHLNNTHTAETQKPALQLGSVSNRVGYITAVCLRRPVSPEVKWAGGKAHRASSRPPLSRVSVLYLYFFLVLVFCMFVINYNVTL